MNLEFLKNIKTEYSHENIIKNNLFNVDCSGFITWLLNKEGYQNSINEIENFTKNIGISNDRLFVIDFIRYFKEILNNKVESKYWEIINLNKIKPGNICVLQTNEKTEKNNHHRHMFITLDVKGNELTILHSTNKHPTKKSGIQIDKIKIENNHIQFDDFEEIFKVLYVGKPKK